MNRSTAAAMLRRGKHLAPDRFQAIPRDDAGAVALLDAWVDALAGEIDLPEAVWVEAATLWATHRAGDRMATPRDLLAAARDVRDRWDRHPELGPRLADYRARRLDARYAQMGLDPTSPATPLDAPDHSAEVHRLVHHTARTA